MPTPPIYAASMLAQWIIERKRDGNSLSDTDIRSFISGYVNGEIPDYQMSALAMAVFFKGMDHAEIVTLTSAMMESGSVLDMSGIPRPKIDKHSTGGIGDKVSIILAPLVSCCGVAVPMIAGRGLGITGGTLDKLESIPGYNTSLPEERFKEIVDKCGCSITGQTENLVPADKQLYALRDVTGTVPSIPLIVASILSKKMAAGLDGLVMDVKCGKGAFMKTTEEARALADSLVAVGTQMGIALNALITDMNQPLGHAVGNALEIAESIQTLQGSGPPDVLELTFALAENMLRSAGICSDTAEATALLEQKIASGEAFRGFCNMVEQHGGELSAIQSPHSILTARRTMTVDANATGFITQVDAEKIGRASLMLGAGRAQVTSDIDHAVGLSGIGKIGDAVDYGQPLAILHANDDANLDAALAMATEAFIVSTDKPKRAAELILERL